MVYMTGDTHGHQDSMKISLKNFPEQKKLTKDDYVLICGDFGMVGNNDDNYLSMQKELDGRSFTTLFVDGNHEGFFELSKYPVVEWNGGKVQFVQPSVIHLMRGQVYTIEGNTFFTMGGASSIDKDFRVPGVSWWPEELPSQDEYAEAKANLDKHNWKVDYVITHTCSLRMMVEMGYQKEDTELNSFFDMLEERLTFKQWYFGHFHDDAHLDFWHTVLYNEVIELKKLLYLEDIYEVVDKALKQKGVEIKDFVEDCLYRTQFINRHHPESVHYILRSNYCRKQTKRTDTVVSPPFWSWTGNADGALWEINTFGELKALEDYLILYKKQMIAVRCDILIAFQGIQPREFKIENDKVFWC